MCGSSGTYKNYIGFKPIQLLFIIVSLHPVNCPLFNGIHSQHVFSFFPSFLYLPKETKQRKGTFSPGIFAAQNRLENLATTHGRGGTTQAFLAYTWEKETQDYAFKPCKLKTAHCQLPTVSYVQAQSAAAR
jgi:hypothetical protein